MHSKLSGNRAIVIGSGFGGLAAALRLRARGYDVQVFERLSQPGGRATVYRRNGFVFDAGPTIVTAPFLLEELFDLFGETMADHIDLRELDLWYRIRFADGETFDYDRSLERTCDEIRRYAPEDVDGYKRFLKDTEEVYRIGFEQLGDQPFHKLRTMIRLIPQLLRLRSDQSVWQRASRYVGNDKIRQVMSFHPLLVGGNPFTTTSIYSLIHYLERSAGVHFAMGGTGAIVDALVGLMERHGVRIELDATVEEIEVEDGRATGARLADGRRFAADVVVANADAATVYTKLLARRHRRRWTDRRVDRLKYSMGLFVLYFGSRRTYPHLAHHEIILGPRYRGLISDIFGEKELAEDFSLYLHAPTRTDPSMAPPGCESMYALVPVPNLRADIDWSEAGPKLRARLVDFLDSTVCPGLRDDITEDFYVTPEHFQNRLLSRHGAGFSIQPLLTQSAWFRFHNRSEEIDGLYLVGAGTHPGAGLPGVLTSAKVLDRVLDEELAEDRRPRLSRRMQSEDPPAESGKSALDLMARRARTFDWGARLLPPALRADVAELYRFCRQVDDAADGPADPALARRWLDGWSQAILRQDRTDPMIAPLLDLAARHDLPLESALDLITGARGDTLGKSPRSRGDLVRYAYRVAGTVGILFSHLAGVRSSAAHRHAVDLGIAMQLTNIARDVSEDAMAGRFYLPADWIHRDVIERAVGGDDVAAATELWRAVVRLLDLAEHYYASGEAGARYLPWTVRWGVLTAARSYRAIGDEIRRRGLGYWDERVATSTTTRIGRSLTSLAAAVFPPRAAAEPELDLHAPLRRLQGYPNDRLAA